MIDQHEIDRAKIFDLLEQTSDTVLKQVIFDCNWLLERKQLERKWHAQQLNHSINWSEKWDS